MKDSKDNKGNRTPVKYTAVDWDSYKIKKDEKEVRKPKKGKSEWTQPEVTEKWIIDKAKDDRHAYDFAADEEFTKAMKELDKKPDKKREKKEKPEPEIKEIDNEPQGKVSDVKKEEKKDTAIKAEKKQDAVIKAEEKQDVGSKTRKKKSLGTKLDELGSTWVSTGNFRNNESLDDKAFKDLENNIIVEAKKRSSDEVLSKAVARVNEALMDEDGYEPLGEVSLGDTFEIPKLDIHFGDTEDLKEAKDDLKDIKSEDLKREIEKLDRAAEKKARGKKESDERDKIIVKSDELKKKKKKKRPAAEDEELKTAETAKKKRRKTPEEEKPAATGKKSSSASKEAAKTGTGKSGTKKAGAEKTAKRKSGAGKTDRQRSGAVKSATTKQAGRKTKTETPLKGKRPAELNKSGVKKPQKKGSSDFRKRSADWKDKKTIDKTAKVVSFEERKKQFIERIKKVTPIQWSIAAMGVIIFITGIMTTAAYANYQGETNKALAIKSLDQYKEDESYAAATSVTEEMIPEAAEEPEPVQAKTLSLEMTSVEKDLKIKLVDDEDTLVKDVPWSVTVTEDPGDDSQPGEGKVYEDDDMDGTIYIENIAAGDYDVVLNPSDALAAYILPTEKQLVSVKAAIEYKVIANIKDEIKSEKEVNVALEDPNGNQAADVEEAAPVNNDTVQWFESSKEANGDEYVEATPDLSKTAASAKKNTGFLAALKQLGKGTRNTGNKRSVLGFNGPLGYLVATENSDIIPETIPETTSSSSTETTSSSSETSSSSTETTTSSSSTENKDTVVITSTSSSSTETQQVQEQAPVSEEASLAISGQGSVVVGSSVTISASYTPGSSTISWSISDSAIASISDGGSTCQVTGVKAGEATLTATCSNGKETTMKISVTDKEPEYSDDAQLYDASKNALYVKDGDTYRLATYGDYKSGNFSTYYRKQEAFLYTGWQDIDGRTYYFLGDHTYVTGEQTIQGIKYNFGSDGALSKGSGTLGIDVSKYQPSINWEAVKASGVNYVIIRCGYRGASTGALIQDPYFTSHIKGAKAAGLKVGIYFFTTALNETEAVEEASMCAALCSGYGINYPIFMDCESSPRPGYNELSASDRTAIIKAFCNTIKSAGYTPGVYANKTWLSSKMNASSLSGAKIWLAQYNSAGPTYSGRYDLWQYTSKGHVDGISGNVDMNQSYLGY